MPTYAEVVAALPEFRNHVVRGKHLQQLYPNTNPAAAASIRGAYNAFPSLEANIHATGAGIRQRAGKYHRDEFVLKVFVFDKLGNDDINIPDLQEFQGIPVDVENLPVQRIRPMGQAVAPAPRAILPFATPLFRSRQRPILGGISVSPLNAPFVGTLGCFLLRKNGDSETLFALSNNHVFADVDTLAKGTPIVQPGPEAPSFATDPADVFATLDTAIPIHFPTQSNDPVTNHFDAATAVVTNSSIVQPGQIFGISNYDPTAVVSPTPGMRVVKAGRTSGKTFGTISAIHVRGVQVNYGSSPASPKIAIYDDVVTIVGDNAQPFSMPGDSGSIIVDVDTGHPVALLFAGDGRSTTACDLGMLCQQLAAWPV